MGFDEYMYITASSGSPGQISWQKFLQAAYSFYYYSALFNQEISLRSISLLQERPEDRLHLHSSTMRWFIHITIITHTTYNNHRHYGE